MQFLNLHGCLPTSYLFGLEQSEPLRDDNGDLPAHYLSYIRAAQHQLLRLWRAGFICRPIQQRATDNANYHEYVYDLTEKGRAYLVDDGLWLDSIRPTGPWVHQLFVSCVTASIDLLCRRDGYRYVPPHEYLAGKSMKVDVPFRWKDGRVHTQPLCPDAVFAIDYGKNRYIAFALEADRNTETAVSKKRRSPTVKTHERTIRQYAGLIGGKLYKKAYAREAHMVLLFITVSPGKARKFADLVGPAIGACSYIAAGHVEEMGIPFKPPPILEDIWSGDLLRFGKEPFVMKKAA